ATFAAVHGDVPKSGRRRRVLVSSAAAAMQRASPRSCRTLALARGERLEYSPGVLSPGQRAERVCTRVSAKRGCVVRPTRQVDDRRRERAGASGLHEYSALSVAEEGSNLTEIRGKRARARGHVLDNLQGREVEARQGQERCRPDVPARDRRDRVPMRQPSQVAEAADRKVGLAHDRSERTVAGDLEPKTGCGNERVAESFQQQLDAVPGLQAAGEA